MNAATLSRPPGGASRPISIFLTDARNKTLPIKMLQYLEEQPDPTLAAISSGLILLALIVLMVGSRTVGLNRMIQ